MTIEVTLAENEVALAVVQFLRNKKFTCNTEDVQFVSALDDNNKQIISVIASVGQKDTNF